ncbi:MAG: GTP cyclohydrolase I FolE [Acidobacteriaceae bacterium]|jgi:GTP cyclohydrolase I
MANKFELEAVVKNGTAGNGNGSAHSALTHDDAALTGPDAGLTLQDASVQAIYAELLKRIGEDPTRNGLEETPRRMEKSMAFLTKGYGESVESVLHGALFEVDYDEMVIVRDIEFYSLCEHHLLPFFGKAHIAYVPQGKVVGLSKLPRIVDVFARRLQVQERLTQQIAEAVEEAIAPQGVGVLIEAQHLCMMMRGVEKQSSVTVTSSLRGVFKTQLQTRSEFLALVRAER